MFLIGMALLHAVACLDIQIEGDLDIDLKIPKSHSGKQRFRVGWESHTQATESVYNMMRQNMTVAPKMECIYQYPEKEQVNALLSNMMNELTKIFVRANDFIKGFKTRRMGLENSRRGELDANVMKDIKELGKKEVKKETRKEAKKNKKKGEKKDIKEVMPRRLVGTRFKVVKKKQKAFFELIYTNMTDEYRHFYNTTVERVDRSGRDPCQHQEEVKQIWRNLLEHALSTLKNAAHRCVEEYLREQHVEPDAKVRVQLQHYLTKELRKMRANQLGMLCDTYQLCYNDFLI